MLERTRLHSAHMAHYPHAELKLANKHKCTSPESVDYNCPSVSSLNWQKSQSSYGEILKTNNQLRLYLSLHGLCLLNKKPRRQKRNYLSFILTKDDPPNLECNN